MKIAFFDTDCQTVPGLYTCTSTRQGTQLSVLTLIASWNYFVLPTEL